MFIVEKYKSSYLKEMSELFYNTVHSVNLRDYSDEQVSVWADGNWNMDDWDKRFKDSYTVVVIYEGKIVGFGNIENNGYLDMLYTHKDYQRKGIATTISDNLESTVDSDIEVYASITARKFFENRGYRVINENTVEKSGVILKNYRMRKLI